MGEWYGRTVVATEQAGVPASDGDPAGPSRRDLLRGAVALPLLPALGSRVGSRRGEVPRHVLLLVADDMSRIGLGMGATPVLDDLARDGMSFSSAYTPAPICKPARACMYTGLYPQRSGVTGFGPIREEVTTWPEVLRAADCTTAMIGKLHVEPLERFRFDTTKGGVPFVDDRSPAAFERTFDDFLDGVGTGRFAAVINFKDPHRPFAGNEVTARERDPALEPHDPAAVNVPPFLVDTPETRLELASYQDALRRLDATVGRLLDVLERRGAARDTLVVFTSDNGMSFPFAKTTLYEPGINVPLIARWPGGIAPGSRSEALVSLIDLLPTAMEVFGVRDPDDLDGRSLLELLRGGSFERRTLFASHTEHKRGREAPARSVRRGRYKYIHNFRPEEEFFNYTFNSDTWKSWERLAQDDEELAARMKRLVLRPPRELFDLEADPWELENLAGRAEHAQLEKQLLGVLREWMTATGDEFAGELSD